MHVVLAKPLHTFARHALFRSGFATFDEKTMTAGDRHRFDQLVAAVETESWNVDDGERVGGFEPDPAARRHQRQSFPGLEHGKGTVQPPEVIDGGALYVLVLTHVYVPN